LEEKAIIVNGDDPMLYLERQEYLTWFRGCHKQAADGPVALAKGRQHLESLTVRFSRSVVRVRQRLDGRR
jgi:hypothetical protein